MRPQALCGACVCIWCTPTGHTTLSTLTCRHGTNCLARAWRSFFTCWRVSSGSLSITLRSGPTSSSSVRGALWYACQGNHPQRFLSAMGPAGAILLTYHHVRNCHNLLQYTSSGRGLQNTNLSPLCDPRCRAVSGQRRRAWLAPLAETRCAAWFLAWCAHHTRRGAVMRRRWHTSGRIMPWRHVSTLNMAPRRLGSCLVTVTVAVVSPAQT